MLISYLSLEYFLVFFADQCDASFPCRCKCEITHSLNISMMQDDCWFTNSLLMLDDFFGIGLEFSQYGIYADFLGFIVI